MIAQPYNSNKNKTIQNTIIRLILFLDKKYAHRQDNLSRT